MFSLALLWLLERKESSDVFRSMELKVKAHDIETVQRALEAIFERYGVDAELRERDPAGKKHAGTMVYSIDLPADLTTDRISDEINKLSSEHLEGIEWEQQKTRSDIYQ